MLLIFRYIIYTFAVLNLICGEFPFTKSSLWMEGYGNVLQTSLPCRAGLAHPKGFLILFTMLNQKSKVCTIKPTLPAPTGHHTKLNKVVNDFFDNYGSSFPNDILCYQIQNASLNRDITDNFRQELITLNADLIRLLSSLNDLRDNNQNC